jgi:hypothetical protein
VRRLIVVCGQGAFVAAFRNRAEIVLAHVNLNLRSPRRWRSRTARIRSADVAMFSLLGEVVHGNGSQTLNNPRKRYSGTRLPRVAYRARVHLQPAYRAAGRQCP